MFIFNRRILNYYDKLLKNNNIQILNNRYFRINYTYSNYKKLFIIDLIN